VQGSGCRVQGSGFRLSGLPLPGPGDFPHAFRAPPPRDRVQHRGFRLNDPTTFFLFLYISGGSEFGLGVRRKGSGKRVEQFHLFNFGLSLSLDV
jgi:hypothetical protein